MDRKLRHNTSINERDEKGRILKQCCCVAHLQWSFDVEDYSVFKIKESKKYAMKTIIEMKDEGLLSKSANTLCTACYRKFKEKGNNLDMEDNVDDSSDIEIINDEDEIDGRQEEVVIGEEEDDIVEVNFGEKINEKVSELIILLCEFDGNTSDIDSGNISILLALLGNKFISKDLFKDGNEIKGLYKDTDFLQGIDSMQYLLQRNQLLTSFLNGCVNFIFQEQTNKTLLYAYSVAIEMIYFLRNMNLILPHSFLLNLTQMFVSGSKTVSVINGKVSPSASYTSYNKWLQLQGNEKIVTPRDDIIVFFDNIGKYIKKSYRVDSKKIKSADIVTTTLILETKPPTNIQMDEALKPSCWMPQVSDNPEKNAKMINAIQQKMGQVIKDSNKTFREARNLYIAKILELVKCENTSEVQQHIQDLQSSGRACEGCGKRFTNLKRKCDECRGNVTKTSQDSVKITAPTSWKVKKHFDINQKVNINTSTLKTGETILVNPNSYDSVNEVALSLHDQLKIGEEREWAPIGCDGPPYTILARLIEKKTEFGWILLLPAFGHLHMNQLKTFFRVSDDIFMHPLGNQVLNFNWKKAYDYFINAKDTHKSYQMLEILLYGTASEFCHKYIMDNKGERISVAGFLKWAVYNTNETFNLMFQLIFIYAFAIYAQKIGVRCNDHLLTDAARYKFMPMFYGFRHPIYQEIEYRDLQNKAIYPEAIKQFTKANTSFTTHKELDHQGADFCLEGKIKRQKMMAPKGIVTKEVWQRIARSVDKVECIQKHLNDTLGNVYDEKYRDIDIYKEICKWRATLRLSKILEVEEETGVIVNIYNEPLSSDLDDLTHTLNAKVKVYWDKVASGIAPQNIREDALNISEKCLLNDLEWSDIESDLEE